MNAAIQAIDPQLWMPPRTYQRNALFARGEVPRLALDVMREAGAAPFALSILPSASDMRELALASLRAAGHEAAGFKNPITALDAIEANSRVRVLVAGVDSGKAR